MAALPDSPSRGMDEITFKDEEAERDLAGFDSPRINQDVQPTATTCVPIQPKKLALPRLDDLSDLGAGFKYGPPPPRFTMPHLPQPAPYLPMPGAINTLPAATDIPASQRPEPQEPSQPRHDGTPIPQPPNPSTAGHQNAPASCNERTQGQKRRPYSIPEEVFLQHTRFVPFDSDLNNQQSASNGISQSVDPCMPSYSSAQAKARSFRREASEPYLQRSPQSTRAPSRPVLGQTFGSPLSQHREQPFLPSHPRFHDPPPPLLLFPSRHRQHPIKWTYQLREKAKQALTDAVTKVNHITDVEVERACGQIDRLEKEIEKLEAVLNDKSFTDQEFKELEDRVAGLQVTMSRKDQLLCEQNQLLSEKDITVVECQERVDNLVASFMEEKNSLMVEIETLRHELREARKSTANIHLEQEVQRKDEEIRQLQTDLKNRQDELAREKLSTEALQSMMRESRNVNLEPVANLLLEQDERTVEKFDAIMSFLRTSSEDRIGVSGLEEAANKLKANLIATLQPPFHSLHTQHNAIKITMEREFKSGGAALQGIRNQLDELSNKDKTIQLLKEALGKEKSRSSALQEKVVALEEEAEANDVLREQKQDLLDSYENRLKAIGELTEDTTANSPTSTTSNVKPFKTIQEFQEELAKASQEKTSGIKRHTTDTGATREAGPATKKTKRSTSLYF